MINHVVLFKVNDEHKDNRLSIITKIKSDLLALDGVIPELKYIEVGLNHELESDNFDICLITHFESIDDLNVYQVHPEHKKVGAYLRQFVKQRSCVDFEF